MAKKNILGEGFPKYVRDQVKIRQDGLGENPISNASIIKNNGKTAWLKLASSVDLNAQAQRELSITANVGEGYENKNYLARSLVLYNGTYNQFTDQFGEGIVGPSLLTGEVINLDTGNIAGSGTVSTQGGAYGFGGFEQGAVPMPGVIDFKVTPRNRGGIRDATINIQANNLRQFQLLESLYLRLGYHVLIEWGWTNYYDNDGNLIIRDDVQSPVLAAFLHTGQSAEYYNVLSLISKEKEKSNGNYDALLGRVVNFTWTLRDGGGYDISIRVLSAGDIIDSLKLPNLPISEIALIDSQIAALQNQTTEVDSKSTASKLFVPVVTAGVTGLAASVFGTDDPPRPNSGVYASTPQANKSSLHRWLWLIEHILTPNTDESGNRVDMGAAPATSNRAFRDYYISIFNRDFGIKPEFRPYPGTGTFGANGSYLTKIVPGTDARNEVKTSYGKAKLKRIGAWFGQFRTSNTNILNKETQVRDYYVSFGNVLGFISKTLLYYNQNTEQPIIDIDFDLDNNLCYTYPIVPELCNTTTLSVNDDICLVNAYANVGTLGNSSIQSLWPDVFPLQDDQFNEGATNSHGRIMAINLTTSFVKRCADSAYDTVEHTINLNTFLDAILKGINSCFYGTINLVTQIDPDTNILYILDLSQIPDIESLGVDTTLTKFRVSGYNLGEASFLKEVNITSEISKNIANQLVIGAQQSGNVVSNVPTGLTQFNQGYTDRVFIQKLDSYQTKAQIRLDKLKKTKEEELQLKRDISALKLFGSQYQIFIHYISEALKNKLPPDSSKTQYYNIVESIIKWELSQITSDLVTTTTDSGTVDLQGQNPPGYIPISLNLTMEGLSGMKLFNKFSISEEYLPFSYRKQFDFIVKGITHELKDNYWNTQIESLCVPKPRNILGSPTSGIGILSEIPTTPGTSGASGGSSDGSSKSKSQCATDPNDNFGRLIGDESQIPAPFNKKFTATRNKQIIYAMFRIAGFTQAQTAVALANAQGESGFNNLAIGDSCQSYGLFQLHSVNGVGKSALIKNYPYVVPTERIQLFDPFINTLIIISAAANQGIQNAPDLFSATVAFVNKVERPLKPLEAEKKRIILAEKFKTFSLTKEEYISIANVLKKSKFTTKNGIEIDGLTALISTGRFYGLTPNTQLYQ